jgi:hypothetical protein
LLHKSYINMAIAVTGSKFISLTECRTLKKGVANNYKVEF